MSSVHAVIRRPLAESPRPDCAASEHSPRQQKDVWPAHADATNEAAAAQRWGIGVIDQDACVAPNLLT